MAKMNEAYVTINGEELTTGESMTLRVALSNFAMELKDGMAKELGPIGIRYEINLRSILLKIGKTLA